jgi:hypothetical protein
VKYDKERLDPKSLCAMVIYIRWYNLRHIWASWYIRNDISLAALKERGDWHDRSMVMRFTHLPPEHLMQYAGYSQDKLCV